MKVAVAQFNPKVGDIEGNTQRIIQTIESAEKQAARLVLFPELVFTGYPPQDLLFSKELLSRQIKAINQVTAVCLEITVIAGCISATHTTLERPLRNSAIVIQPQKLTQYYHKQILPTYDVFDEDRYFEPGQTPLIIEIDGAKIGITICEDIWNFEEFRERPYSAQPLDGYVDKGLSYLVNLSSSPYCKGKPTQRLKLIQKVSKYVGCTTIYCNQVGSNDELIFDGCSLAVDSHGNVRGQGPSFKEELLFWDTDQESNRKLPEWPLTDISWIENALECGLKEFVSKCGAKKVLLGLSGGIDSSVVAALAVKALGPGAVLGILMPSQFTSAASCEDARLLAQALGMKTLEIPIDPSVSELTHSITTALHNPLNDSARENLQPRVRMAMLMAVANQECRLLLNTSNKSEIATGYSTQYGDTAGALSVIGDLVKGEVYALGRALNNWKYSIPDRVFDRAPTAELKVNQTDQDRLPPYPILDAMVKKVFVEGIDFDALTEFEKKWVDTFRTLYVASEFKRRQFPPILRINRNAFGMGRRIPTAAQID